MSSDQLTNHESRRWCEVGTALPGAAPAVGAGRLADGALGHPVSEDRAAAAEDAGFVTRPLDCRTQGGLAGNFTSPLARLGSVPVRLVNA